MSTGVGPRKERSGRGSARTDRQDFALRFVRRVILWILPVAVVWSFLTPSYNLFLTEAAENLVRITEDPAVTRLLPRPPHHFVVTRTDFSTAKGWLYSVRTTDAHFHFIMLWAFFLAVPDTPWPKRLENLGLATLVATFFQIILLLCWVKFAYATQLGEWSGSHYSTFQQNFWGLSKHLLDLPFKFALPFLLWASFYLGHLLPRDDAPSSGRRR
jgi:hypothetical protein